MFWKILHLLRLRHSSEPPQLSPKSPLRIYFHKHGEAVARHPLRTILCSVLVVILACYPLPFLYGPSSLTSASGAIAIPSHVWTTSRPFSSYSHEPDIEIKQVWVQGSYMGALKKEILEKALRVQEKLLGNYTSCYPPQTSPQANDEATTMAAVEQNRSLANAFFHSPLMYWDCSLDQIQKDNDLLETVNQHRTLKTDINLTLRWGSVLAGKGFSQNRLIEADALVVSLFYRPGAPAEKMWNEQAAKLAEVIEEMGLEMYPRDGRVTKYSHYEFVFQPMNGFDIFVIVACYSLLLIYLGAYMRRMPAVRSRFGLYLTFVLEVFASVFSSFTVLAVLKIPVSHIPREFYPFVVMVIGLENMSRLINAVFGTPPEMPVQNRIATAVGKVGFLSTVAVATDLMLLFVVAQISLPAVKEICAFAGLAIFLDFLLHLTFFVAVLRVEISRLELKDFLERSESKSHTSSENRRSLPYNTVNGFTDMILDMGNAPVSSRVAGTIIMICFVIALNYHFVENETVFDKLRQLFYFLQDMNTSSNDMMPAFPMNQARTPTSWLRLQDQLTGKELIDAVKQGAGRIVAKVYNPLFFMIEGSNRTKPDTGPPGIDRLIEIDFSTLRGHFRSLLYTVAVLLALVTLFLNYLLGFGTPEDEHALSDEIVSPVSCKSLEFGHTLDVVLVVASKKGLLVSVGLDRKIVVWKLRATDLRYSKEEIRPTCPEHILWPILSIAIDDEGEWIAIAPQIGQRALPQHSRHDISLWNVKESRFEPSLPMEFPDGRPPGFFFAPKTDSPEGPRLLVIKSDGSLRDFTFLRVWGSHSGPSRIRLLPAKEHQICTEDPIISAQSALASRSSFRIISTTLSGKVFESMFRYGSWTTQQLWSPAIPSNGLTERTVTLVLPKIRLMLYASSGILNVVEFRSGHTLRTLQTGHIRQNTLRAFNGNRQSCLSCGSVSVTSFSIAYTLAETGMFVMNTYHVMSRNKSRRICLRSKSTVENDSCFVLEDISESAHWFERAGGWEVTALNSVIGLHRPQSEGKRVGATSREYDLRRRHVSAVTSNAEDNKNWEIWTMEFDGKVALYSLDEWSESNNPLRARHELLVSRIGPVARIGPRTVGVGFGNNIKILTLGFERFHEDDSQDDIPHGATYPRKRAHRSLLYPNT